VPVEKEKVIYIVELPQPLRLRLPYAGLVLFSKAESDTALAQPRSSLGRFYSGKTKDELAESGCLSGRAGDHPCL